MAAEQNTSIAAGQQSLRVGERTVDIALQSKSKGECGPMKTISTRGSLNYDFPPLTFMDMMLAP